MLVPLRLHVVVKNTEYKNRGDGFESASKWAYY